MNNIFEKRLKISNIAMVCHEALRSWCEVNGDHTQEIWMNAPDWQKDAIKAGVRFLLENPNAGHDASHNAWMEKKIADGWIYGPVKDAEAKEHPCIVPFDQLSEFERKKDELICAIVNILK